MIVSSRVLASGAAGGFELCIFYPLDTVSKRLMNSRDSFSRSNWQKIVLQGNKALSLWGTAKSLFPGLSFGAAYKVTQRAYVWGGQPAVKDFFSKHSRSHDKFSKTRCDGAAGAVMGMGEVALLPLNALKTKAQTNPDYQTGGLSRLVQEQGLTRLYAGWQWTVARNVPGSFALFGANAFVKEYVFGLRNHKDATVMQTAISSSVGCASSIIVACPFDVVKTRIQSGTFGDVTGTQIVRSMVQQEGLSAIFKGALPKIVTVGPKLAFSFTIAQCLMARFDRC
jgi:hypothetical protein